MVILRVKTCRELRTLLLYRTRFILMSNRHLTRSLKCYNTYVSCLFFFFFSSRRRHTRSDRDWSSDVCSSDLRDPRGGRAPLRRRRARQPAREGRAPREAPRPYAAGADRPRRLPRIAEHLLQSLAPRRRRCVPLSWTQDFPLDDGQPRRRSPRMREARRAGSASQARIRAFRSRQGIRLGMAAGTAPPPPPR